MNKPIYILGAGGHAKVLCDCLLKNNTKVLGFLEINTQLIGKKIFDIPVCCQSEVINHFSPEEICLVNGIGSVHIPELRKQQFEKYKMMGYEFYSVIHPASYQSDHVILNEGTQLLAGSIVTTGTKIGKNTIINTAASVDHDCIIGNHVHIAPGVVLSGNIVIEDNCHIGVGAKIIQGIHIGKNSLIAAGAVVIQNIAPYSRAAGVPAKIME